jgi:3-polyprenyl-4-hydroxybenzoate decarboxylase
MTQRWVVLNPDAAVVGNDRGVHVFRPESDVMSLDAADGQRLTTIQEELLGPVSADTATDRLGEDLLGQLLETGALISGERVELEGMRPRIPEGYTKPLKRMVLGVCGAVAAAMVVPQMVMCALDLLADEVDVVLTKSARRFLRPKVLRYLGARTFTNGFKPRSGAAVPHIHLSQNVDAVVIAPASAAALSRFANGSCDDLMSLIVTATKAPVIVAPVMHNNMWRHPTTVRNVAQLRADGVYVVATALNRSVASRTGGTREEGIQAGAMGLGVANLVSVVGGIVDQNRSGQV